VSSPYFWKLFTIGNEMSKAELKKKNLLVTTVAGAVAAALAFITVELLGLSRATEDTGQFLLKALLFGCLFSVFSLFTLRLSKWLYS
jgi:preprotein translocase subunit SecY